MQTEQEVRTEIHLIPIEKFNEVSFETNPFAVTDNDFSPHSLWLNGNEAVLVINQNPNCEIFTDAENTAVKKENIKSFLTLITRLDCTYFVEIGNSDVYFGIYFARFKPIRNNIMLQIRTKFAKNIDDLSNKFNLTFLTESECYARGKILNEKRKDFYTAFIRKPPIKQPDSLVNLALIAFFNSGNHKKANLPIEISERFIPLESQATKILETKTQLAKAIYEFSEENIDKSKPIFILHEIPEPKNSDSQYFQLATGEQYGEINVLYNQILRINKVNNTCLLFKLNTLEYFNEYKTMEIMHDFMEQFPELQLKLLPNSEKPLKTIYETTISETAMALPSLK